MNNKDHAILKELGKEFAEIAALDIQNEKKDLWRKLNGLRETRPMVMIDQLPWNELDVNNELTLRCEDVELRTMENSLRRTLYKWRHFPADMVIENYISLPKTIRGDRLGPPVKERTAITDSTSDVLSHHYIDQLADEAAVESLQLPVVEIDTERDQRQLALMQEIFDGIMRVKLTGVVMHLGLWDKITSIRGTDPIVYDIIDRPEFTLKIVNRFFEMAMSLLDQYESLNLLEPAAPEVHCTGAYTDELHAANDEGTTASAKNAWGMGLAQIFSTVSPAMHDEFEIIPLMPLFDRFGLIYYGCCDPLDRKIDIVRKIKNCRKISVSPWADKVMSAENIHGDFVFSNKPSPAYLAGTTYDTGIIRKDMAETVKICRDHDTPCELILKDISTVRYQPQRLTEWEQIAMEVVSG